MSNRSKTFLLLLVDVLILCLSVATAIYLRRPEKFNQNYLLLHLKLFSWVLPIFVTTFVIEGLYSLRLFKFKSSSLIFSILRASIITIISTILIIYFLPPNYSGITPKFNLLLSSILAIPLIYLWRIFFFKYFFKYNRLRNTVLIGCPSVVSFVRNEIEKKPFLGFKVIPTTLPISPLADVVAIERHSLKDETYQEVFEKLGSGLEVIDIALFSEMISGKIPLESIDESWFIEYCGFKESRSFDIIKNIIDKTVAIFLLIILIPPFLLFLLPILLIIHGRPVFFKQTRTGLYNKPFTLYKLRTMVKDAEKNGVQWAQPKDTRITPLGKFLRKTRLDELPQLINILKGEMSLVGPRPERPEIIETKLVPNIPFYNLRHLVKPGVTGWAQVVFRYGFSQEDSKEKLQYDLFYVKNKSMWLDTVIFLKTIKTVITGNGQ